MAATALVGADFEPLNTTRFREIFEHVADGSADLGVVPIENALAGSIHENYDLLGEFACSIIGEHYCPVQLHLMVLPGTATSPSELTHVVSHPKALEQCSTFLESLPILTQVNYSDTAGAALHVRERREPTVAAIASEEAASTYGLTILARGIQNHALNATRFVAISSQPRTALTGSKCSLLLTLPHEPGSLARILTAVANLRGNVTKIESRPILGKPFEYRFYIDIESPGPTHSSLQATIEAVRKLAASCRVVGAYDAATDGA